MQLPGLAQASHAGQSRRPVICVRNDRLCPANFQGTLSPPSNFRHRRGLSLAGHAGPLTLRAFDHRNFQNNVPIKPRNGALLVHVDRNILSCQRAQLRC